MKEWFGLKKIKEHVEKIPSPHELEVPDDFGEKGPEAIDNLVNPPNPPSIAMVGLAALTFAEMKRRQLKPNPDNLPKSKIVQKVIWAGVKGATIAYLGSEIVKRRRKQ